MARWYRWSMMALILLVVWGCAKSSSLEGQGLPLSGQLHDAMSAWGFAFYNGLEGWHGIDDANGRQAFAVRSRR